MYSRSALSSEYIRPAGSGGSSMIMFVWNVWSDIGRDAVLQGQFTARGLFYEQSLCRAASSLKKGIKIHNYDM